jgi:hypothetical protein
MAVAAADAAAASSQSSPLHPLPSQTPSNISTTDLHTLQMALQQQQQTLQQQLQSFLLLQTPATTQTSAMMVQSQVQRAVVQASNQLRQLQSHKLQQQSNRMPDTPKSMPMSPDYSDRDDHFAKLNVRPTSTQRPTTTTTTSSHSSSSPPPLTSLSPSPFSPFSPLGNPRSMSPLMMQQQQQQSLVGRLDLPADENIDLEELERFAKEFKQRRIKLG